MQYFPNASDSVGAYDIEDFAGIADPDKAALAGKSRGAKAAGTPVVALDYAFFSRRGDTRRGDREGSGQAIEGCGGRASVSAATAETPVSSVGNGVFQMRQFAITHCPCSELHRLNQP